MVSFLLRSYFFGKIRPLASSKQRPTRRPAPGRTDSIQYRDQKASEKHRRVYTSSNVCHSHEWRVYTASGKTLKKRNACLHAVRQTVEKKLRVYTASEAIIIYRKHYS